VVARILNIFRNIYFEIYFLVNISRLPQGLRLAHLLHHALEEGLSDKLALVRLQLNTNGLQHLVDLSVLLVHDGLEKGGDGGGNELAERTLKSASLIVGDPLLSLNVVEPISPKLGHHLLLRDTKLGSVGHGELLKGEGPLVEAGPEGNGSLGGVNLDVSELLVVVGGNDDVDTLDGAAESLVELLSRKLKLKEGAVNLVDHQAGLDALGNGLAKDGLGLNADTVNGVDDNEGSVSHTEGGCDLRGEVNVTGGVDQVDQVTVSGNFNVLVGLNGVLELDVHGSLVGLGHTSSNSNVLGGLGILKEHTNSGGLDGNSTLGLISTGVGVPGSSGSLGGNNSGLLNQRVCKGGLSVVYVSNHRHGTDVVLELHDGTHLIDGKVNLREGTCVV